jgi:hypothetical protein
MNRAASPPKADEFEVSVFGPGYGESVLVHLGDDQWLIVDSCRDQRTRRQPALCYLDRIGVEPENAVRVVLATHWHRDHVRGIAEVVGRCVNADFWTSAAITSREALVLTGRIGSTQLTLQSPLREMYDVLERLRIRSEGTGAPTVKTAGEGSIIYRRVRLGVTLAEVRALSPHNSAVDVTRGQFAGAANAPRGVARVPEIHPNHAAIVLHVRVGTPAALLGSDLENTAPGGGWANIATRFAGSTRSVIFKVPHHGSVTAHCPEVWASMLAGDVVTAITPFRPGDLPRHEMITEIVDRCGRGFVTAPPRKPKQRETPRRTRALMRGATVRLEELEGRSGHVRMRCVRGEATASNVDVLLRFPALRLDSLVSSL